MLVVCYLISAKKCIIIPQEWIMGLRQETLNNIGKASFQSRRIFWSNLGVDSEGIPDTTITPQFCRKICSIFPPTENEVCYIARVKCFCSNLVRAKYFRDTFRAQLPILYNTRRKFDKPLPEILPPLSSNVRNTSDPGQPLAAETNAAQFENEASIDPVASQSSDRIESDSEVLQEEQALVEPANLESNDIDEVKCYMPNVELNEIDSLAISDVFNDEPQDEAHDIEYESTVLHSIETTFEERGVLKIKRVYSEDCEMIYPHGVKLMPKDPLYSVKLNDPISMNIPYKENVSLFKLYSCESFGFQNKLYSEQANGDRAYLNSTKTGAKEFTLAGKIINGLKQLNATEKRENTSFDKAFIKALLVGIAGISVIKSQSIDKSVMKFIKGSSFIIE